MDSILLKKLDTVEHIAGLSKISRLINNPAKYISAVFFRLFIYPKKKEEKITETELFFGRKMKIALPASTDIYLTGGKSHSSEIRLARFLILNLKRGNHFLDIGAHFGYFTLLAHELAGNEGKIISFEPTTKSFELLKQNTQSLKGIAIFQKAISGKENKLVFYEFPNLHSEYNSTDVSQFKNEEWFESTPPLKVEVEATTIDQITKDDSFKPDIIKIDVEGAEYEVIAGGIHFFKNNSPEIVMEYLEPSRKNDTHKKASALLLSLGYHSHIITQSGHLQHLDSIDKYLLENNLDSDNIVFIKKS